MRGSGIQALGPHTGTDGRSTTRGSAAFIVIHLVILVAVAPLVITPIHAQEQNLPRVGIDELVAAHDRVTQYLLSQGAAASRGTVDDSHMSRSYGSSELPIFMSFVNRTSNELVVGLDQNATGTADQYTGQIRQVVNSPVPVRLVSGYFVPESCSAVDDGCDPLIGGIEISTSVQIGTLTLPAVNNDNLLGFVMSGHVAGPSSTGAAIYQPSMSNPATDNVGRELTNPPGSRSSDSAFVDTFDRITSEQKIFNPDDPANPYDVIGTKTSAQTAVYDIVYMAGIASKSTGIQNVTTTAGGVLTKGVTIKSPSYGTLTDQIVAGYASASGDSGAPIYSKASGNDVLVNGIHVGKSCFVDFPPMNNSCSVTGPGNILAVYSPWEHVRSELNLRPVTGSLELNAMLDEDFESGLSEWTESGEMNWSIETPAESQVPGHTGANRVAHADDCDRDCVLRSNAVDISGYGAPQLSFWRFVDPSIDSGEYLRVEVSGDGGARWTEAYRWTDGSGDDGAWHRETVSLDPYKSERFKVQFVAKASSASEDLEIDDVTIEESPDGGIDTPAVWRNGIWYVNNGFDGVPEMQFGYGTTGDTAVAGDWDGDGIDTPAVWRNGIWYVNNGFDGVPEMQFGYGTTGDTAVAGDWDGDGIDTPAVWRNGIWYVNNGFDGVPEMQFGYGAVGDTAVAGDWDGS